MAQLVRCLLYKHEESSLICSTQKSKALWYMPITPALGRQKQGGSWGSLVSQPCQIGEFQTSVSVEEVVSILAFNAPAHKPHPPQGGLSFPLHPSPIPCGGSSSMSPALAASSLHTWSLLFGQVLRDRVSHSPGQPSVLQHHGYRYAPRLQVCPTFSGILSA